MGFWFLITHWLIVLCSGLPRCRIYYLPVPISSCYVRTCTGGWGNQKKRKSKYWIFPLAHLWNVARCRMTPKPQARMEMWQCLWFWMIFLPSYHIASHQRLYLVLSFPRGVIVLKNILIFWCVLQKTISVDIYILVQVTKTYCLLLRQSSFKMESQYWILIKIFMYIKDEFLKFMNLSSKYRLLRMCFDKVLFVINTSLSWVEV